MRRILFLLVIALLFLGAPAKAQMGLTPCGTPISLSVSGSSTNAQLSSCGGTLILWNLGTQEAFYKYGTASTTAATTSDWSLPGGAFVVLNLGTNRPYLAAITSTSTTTLRITQGQTR